jgi:hypothetical protein
MATTVPIISIGSLPCKTGALSSALAPYRSTVEREFVQLITDSEVHRIIHIGIAFNESRLNVRVKPGRTVC